MQRHSQRLTRLSYGIAAFQMWQSIEIPISNTDVDQRARSYLHSNCQSVHNVTMHESPIHLSSRWSVHSGCQWRFNAWMSGRNRIASIEWMKKFNKLVLGPAGTKTTVIASWLEPIWKSGGRRTAEMWKSIRKKNDRIASVVKVVVLENMERPSQEHLVGLVRGSTTRTWTPHSSIVQRTRKGKSVPFQKSMSESSFRKQSRFSVCLNQTLKLISDILDWPQAFACIGTAKD